MMRHEAQSADYLSLVVWFPPLSRFEDLDEVSKAEFRFVMMATYLQIIAACCLTSSASLVPPV